MAGENDFIVPFGADAGDYYKTLSQMQESTTEVGKTAVETGQQMTKSFGQGEAAAESLNLQIQENAKTVKALATTAQGAGQQIQKALDGKGIGNGFDEKMKRYTALLTDLSGKAGKPIDLNIDTAKLAAFEKLLSEGVDELQVFSQVVAHAKTELAQLDPGSEKFTELNQQIQTASQLLTALGVDLEDLPEVDPIPGDKPEAKAKSLTAQLRLLKRELADMAAAGNAGSAEFLELEERAGALQDEIGDVSARVKALSSDTKEIDAGVEAVTALAGSFAVAQGAAALFGSESEELNAVIAKVTGAMAVLQGVQAVANALNKDSTLLTLLNRNARVANTTATVAETVATEAEAVATVQATAATNAFTAALLANPFTAIAVLLAAVAAALIYFATQSDDAEKSTEELNNELERQNELLQLDEASISRRTNVQIAAIQLVGAERAKAAKNEGELLKVQQDTERQVAAAQRNALEDRLKLLRTNQAETEYLYNQENADKKKLGDELTRINEQIRDTEADITIQRYNTQSKDLENQIALNKKRQELAKQATQAAKEEADKQKAILDQQIKFAKQLRDAELFNITDDYAKQRQQVKNKLQDDQASLNAEKLLSTKAQEERTKLLAQLEKNAAKQLEDIDKEEARNKLALQLQTSIEIEGLQKESYTRQQNELKLNFQQQRADIEDRYKDQAEQRKALLDELAKAEIEQTKTLNQQITLDRIDKETERQVLLVETAAKFVGPAEKVEKDKQLAITKVQLDGATQRLNALIASGEAETSTAVLQAKKQVQELQKSVNDQTAEIKASGGGLDIQQLIFGDLGTKGNQAVKDALGKSADAIKEITDFIVDQYQRQIDKKQEVIDKYDEDIDTLEDQLEKEKDLQDQGLANNVDSLQKEIDAKKAAKDEELRQQQEIIKKQQAAAKTQFAIDTALQASNLITAATKIFSSFAGIPFGLGIPLAIAAVALMTGAFVAARVKTYQAISSANEQSQSFGKGGWIDGNDHRNGGKEYRAVDGSGDVVELERDEYVVNAKTAKEHASFLEALNSGAIHGMSDAAMLDLLEPMGIRLPDDDVKESLSVSRERDGLSIVFNSPGPDISQDTKAIRRATEDMADRKRKEIQHWTDGKYNYKKQGHKVTRTKVA